MTSKTENEKKCIDLLKKAITLLGEVNLLLDELEGKHSKAHKSVTKVLTRPGSSKKSKTAKGSALTQNK